MDAALPSNIRTILDYSLTTLSDGISLLNSGMKENNKMCGIVGSVGLRITDKVLNQIYHRGPDGQEIELLNIHGQDVSLAHTRLSILDLSPAGKQPMQSKDGRWWVTFNGEIYNHLDLRKTLQCTFRGHSDTETLVELIAAHGIEKTLPQLNGMFAFAALDTHQGKLYLARDPFGIKPLYYAEKENTFSFSSEVRALKELGIGGDGIDTNAVQLFMTLRYTPSPKTLWNGIKRLAPGHTLCFDIASKKTINNAYISGVTKHFSGSLDDAVDAYRQELQAAINRQLLSDVPVGVLLSGGIDSALVAAMAKNAGRDLPCFTVGFGHEHPECEISDAAETAKVLGLPFSSIEITPDLLMQALPDIVDSVEEPLGTTSIMPMWYLVRKAREDVTVVLTGQGSDEPWGGYLRYQVEIIHRMFPWKSFWLVLKRLASLYGNIPDTLERGLRTLPVNNIAMRMVEACALFNSDQRKSLLGSSTDGGATELNQYWLNILTDDNHKSAEKMMRTDTRMNLSDDLLLYGDKLSMAVALEARVPMLDIQLVNFIESLPLEYRVALKRTKITHKLMAERYLPSAIVHRQKKNFAVPFGEWSRTSWKGFIEDILFDNNAPHWEALNQGTVRQLWDNHINSKPDRSRQIFSLLMLAMWWRAQ